MAFLKTSDLHKRLGQFGEFVGKFLGQRESTSRAGSTKTERDLFLFAGEWVAVSSSNVAMARYTGGTRHLYLQFHGGDVYRYSQISLDEAESFYAAGSKGGWVWDYLRIRGTARGFKKPYTRA